MSCPESVFVGRERQIALGNSVVAEAGLAIRSFKAAMGGALPLMLAHHICPLLLSGTAGLLRLCHHLLLGIGLAQNKSAFAYIFLFFCTVVFSLSFFHFPILSCRRDFVNCSCLIMCTVCPCRALPMSCPAHANVLMLIVPHVVPVSIVLMPIVLMPIVLMPIVLMPRYALFTYSFAVRAFLLAVLNVDRPLSVDVSRLSVQRQPDQVRRRSSKLIGLTAPRQRLTSSTY